MKKLFQIYCMLIIVVQAHTTSSLVLINAFILPTTVTNEFCITFVCPHQITITSHLLPCVKIICMPLYHDMLNVYYLTFYQYFTHVMLFTTQIFIFWWNFKTPNQKVTLADSLRCTYNNYIYARINLALVSV